MKRRKLVCWGSKEKGKVWEKRRLGCVSRVQEEAWDEIGNKECHGGGREGLREVAEVES